MGAILFCSTFARMSDMSLSLDWLSESQRIYFNATVFIHKIVTGSSALGVIFETRI